MLGYVMLGTNDLDRGARFYDAIAAALGAARIMDNDSFIAWGPSDGGPGISLSRPEDGSRAMPGNGMTVALVATGRDEVDQLYALALQMGGIDAGPPSERFTGFYAAYVRDPDGNRVSFFYMG